MHAPLAAGDTAAALATDTPELASADLAVERALPTPDVPPALDASAAERIRAKPLAPKPPSQEEAKGIDAAIAALAHDDVPRNAMKAVHELAAAGDKALPALQAALESHDQQQRHLAAFVLRRVDAEPTQKLCGLSVEALGDPEIEGYWRTLIHRPALSAAHWLQQHARSKVVTPHLLVAARSSQPQRRFLAAALLAFAGVQQDLPNTCAVLLAQLPDNHQNGDALLAAHALYRLGPASLPQIRLAYRGADDQARSLLQLIEENLDDDVNGRALRQDQLRERFDRLMLRKVTTVCIDPARGHRFLYYTLPRL